MELSFDLVWQPWLLSPKLETKVDEKGIAKRLSYEKKFKSSRKYEAYARKIIALGEQETPPIAFNFGENSVTAGTLDAHRLMVLAERFEAERGNRNREFLDVRFSYNLQYKRNLPLSLPGHANTCAHSPLTR